MIDRAQEYAKQRITEGHEALMKTINGELVPMEKELWLGIETELEKAFRAGQSYGEAMANKKELISEVPVNFARGMS